MTAGPPAEIPPPVRSLSGLRTRLCGLLLILRRCGRSGDRRGADRGFALNLGLVRLKSREPAERGDHRGDDRRAGRRPVGLRTFVSGWRPSRSVPPRSSDHSAIQQSGPTARARAGRFTAVAGRSESGKARSWRVAPIRTAIWSQGTRVRGAADRQPIMTARLVAVLDMSLASGLSSRTQGPFIVPVYAPGLPLVMALFERVERRRRFTWCRCLAGPPCGRRI